MSHPHPTPAHGSAWLSGATHVPPPKPIGADKNQVAPTPKLSIRPKVIPWSAKDNVNDDRPADQKSAGVNLKPSSPLNQHSVPHPPRVSLKAPDYNLAKEDARPVSHGISQTSDFNQPSSNVVSPTTTHILPQTTPPKVSLRPNRDPLGAVNDRENQTPEKKPLTTHTSGTVPLDDFTPSSQEETHPQDHTNSHFYHETREGELDSPSVPLSASKNPLFVLSPALRQTLTDAVTESGSVEPFVETTPLSPSDSISDTHGLSTSPPSDESGSETTDDDSFLSSPSSSSPSLIPPSHIHNKFNFSPSIPSIVHNYPTVDKILNGDYGSDFASPIWDGLDLLPIGDMLSYEDEINSSKRHLMDIITSIKKRVVETTHMILHTINRLKLFYL